MLGSTLDFRIWRLQTSDSDVYRRILTSIRLNSEGTYETVQFQWLDQTFFASTSVVQYWTCVWKIISRCRSFAVAAVSSWQIINSHPRKSVRFTGTLPCRRLFIMLSGLAVIPMIILSAHTRSGLQINIARPEQMNSISYQFTQANMPDSAERHLVLFFCYSAGIDFRRQNRTSVDVRFLRLKAIPAL